MIVYEIITELDKIKNFYDQWDRLFDSGIYEASVSVDWTQALLTTHLGVDKLYLIVLKDSTELLGIVPLVVGQDKIRGISVSTAFPISEYYGTKSDLLLKNASPELIAVFLQALFKVPTPWDLFRMGRIADTNPLLLHLQQQMRKASIKYGMRKEESNFLINMNGTFNDYLGERSSNLRKNLRSREKKLHAMGNVEFFGVKDFSNFADAYKKLLYIEENSWKHKHGTSIAAIQKQHDFYRDLGEYAFRKGWLSLTFLFLDKEPIAYKMGLVKYEKYYSLKGSYIDKFNKVSPVTLLMAYLIENLIKDGIKEYDFTGEPYEWESHWTNAAIQHNSLLIYNNTVKAKLFYLYHTIKNKQKRNIKDPIVFHNPRDIKRN